MCGIAGIIGKRDDSLIRVMTETLRHRGPDADGFHCSENFSLGHRRLSVIDLEGGAQPMHSQDQRYCLVYNGEIYNFKALRTNLEKLGRTFHTDSDTEVLLQAYIEYGADCIHHLQGMFAFAVYDAQEQTCFLARDPLGVKPLYYAQHKDALYFASEMKALLAVPDMPREMDYAALDDYFTFLYTMPPRTIYKDIRQLPPGHYALWENGGLQVTRYWRLDCATEQHTEAEWCEELLARFDKTIKDHLIADVPLGAYLSAGLDSASIVASMCRQRSFPVSTFTIGFGNEGQNYDERVAARSLASYLKTEHNELIAKADIVELLPQVLRHFDEPFANPTALLSYLIAQQVRRHVTVVLSGDGGDEIFGGYPRYAGLAMVERYKRLPLWLRERVLHPLIMRLPESTSGFHALRRLREFSTGSFMKPMDCYAYWCSYFTPEEKSRLYSDSLRGQIGDHDAHAPLHALAAECPDTDPVTQAMYIDLHTFLPNNVLQYGDRMSMAHGLETRVPFADSKLVSWAMKMPSRFKLNGAQGKYILRQCMGNRLPEDTLRARKQGFNPPMGVWLNTSLKPLMLECLAPETIARRGFFQPATVQEMIADHQSGRRDYTWHLWALLVFELWHREYID